ncbi:TonB-dependent receptor plug domain-containing protein [Flavobacterium sp.]|uniref:TonB-dependent receptor plug domain-containing protein n=1 Tax=Flavobacterium sp. TaxID=239 RepID=UPI0037B7E4C9
MKNLKQFLLFLILVNSCVTFGQDKNLTEETQKAASKKLYHDLNENEKNPLVVINGFSFESSMAFLNLINPNEIEKIDVLKDASATAAYGDKGKNGVLIITLKDKEINSQRKLNKLYSLENNDNESKKEIIISGIITNTENKPISKVVISDLNAKESYKSDSKGSYTFKAHRNDVLVYFLEGFESKKMVVKKEPEINIVLKKLSNSDTEPEIKIKK